MFGASQCASEARNADGRTAVTRHSPVSNIEQFHSVCGAIFQAGWASNSTGNSHARVTTYRPWRTPNRHVGTARVWQRRSAPMPVMWRRDALVSSFPRARLPRLRSANVLVSEMRRGNYPQRGSHGKAFPIGRLDRTGDAFHLVIRQQCETFFQRKRGFPAATTSAGHSPMIVGEKGIICEED
jgi:hypothetical protein